jgi:hypothetical protein
MNGDTLKKVRPGDPLNYPAATHNAFIDAANWVRSKQLNQSSGPSVTEADPCVVLVKNGTGDDLGRFAVLTLGDPLILHSDSADGFAERVTFAGDTPDADTPGKFCITIEPIADGDCGRAVVMGAIQVQIDVTDADHKFADVSDGDTDKLKSGGSGAAQIIWKETGTGTKWAIVRLGATGNQIFMVKVYKDGGTAGDQTHACSFTYTAKTFAGDELDTGLTPTFNTRGAAGKMVVAADGTNATAFYDGDTLKLLQTTEVASKGTC